MVILITALTARERLVTHLQKDATVSINIRPRVLDLANAAQYVRYHSVQVGHQLEQRIIGQPLESKLTLADIARISHTKHGVTVTWNYLTSSPIQTPSSSSSSSSSMH